jgi:vacuolar-type H+-ATPase subunit E/Vma4
VKISRGEIFTTTELMKEFFGMADKLIYNMTEKARYERIYNYLIENSATRLEDNDQYLIFNLEGDTYLIPKEIFDELDSSWTEGLKVKEKRELQANNRIDNQNEVRLRLVY